MLLCVEYKLINLNNLRINGCHWIQNHHDATQLCIRSKGCFKKTLPFIYGCLSALDNLILKFCNNASKKIIHYATSTGSVLCLLILYILPRRDSYVWDIILINVWQEISVLVLDSWFHYTGENIQQIMCLYTIYPSTC